MISKRECLVEGCETVEVRLATAGVEPLGVGSDIPEKMQGMSGVRRVMRRGFYSLIAEAPRPVEVAEQ